MARSCEICGKGPKMGNQVTIRGKAKYLGGVGTKITGISPRQFKPNLQRVRATVKGTNKTLLVCTQCLRECSDQADRSRAISATSRGHGQGEESCEDIGQDPCQGGHQGSHKDRQVTRNSECRMMNGLATRATAAPSFINIEHSLRSSSISPMSLTREQVEKVSLLGRLRLSDAELDTMTVQLAAIVGYIELLAELDTSNVAPMAHAVELHNVFRPDEVRPSVDRARICWPALLRLTASSTWCPRCWGSNALMNDERGIMKNED